MSDYLPQSPQYINFRRYYSLATCWDYSRTVIQDLTQELASQLSSNVLTVALAGSFGRMEGSTSSDVDYIMVVQDTNDTDADRDKIHTAIAKFNLTPPNKAGIFSQPRTLDHLIAGMGGKDESLDMLGKRMLMLLESKPLYDQAGYEAVLRVIFDKYVEYVTAEPEKDFVFLLNDLVRYFRSICVNYQSDFWRQNEKWPIRNLKLRHSRILMYGGLLALLGEASKYRQGKIEFLWEHLRLTPMERFAYVYQANQDYGFFRLAGLYNVFLARLADENVRIQLTEISYAERYQFPIFAELKANSDAFVSEVTRFILARRGQWSERFFEYLIF